MFIVETTVFAIAHEWFEWIISPIDCAPVTDWMANVLNVEWNCLFTDDNTATATYNYKYLLQLNKTTFHMYNLRLAPLSNYTLLNLYATLCEPCVDR